MSKQAIIITVIIVYIIIRSLIIEPGSIKITRYEVESNELSGVKAVFLSDLHLKRQDYKRLDRIIDLTNSEAPDIVFFGGDFAKYTDKKKNMKVENLAARLTYIRAPKYAVLGDDDWHSNYNEYMTQLKKNKITVLENNAVRTVVRGRHLDIIGLKDITMKDVNITKAMKRTKMPRVVLTHNPDIYYDVLDDVTLILAGHTHGGQIVIPMTAPLFVPSRYGAQFSSGLKTPKDNKIIISKGLGTDKFPARLNCKPEIVVIEFIRNGSGRNTR